MYLKYTKYYVYKILYFFICLGKLLQDITQQNNATSCGIYVCKVSKELMHACLIMNLNSMQSAMY